MPLPEHTALVHDWLTGMRGGEKCLEVLCELFPGAPIYTLLSLPDKLSDTINAHPIRTSFIQRLPAADEKYRNYLPLFPRAIESFNLEPSRLIVSTSHAVAKGVIPPPGALHISYIHTPMRYVWDMFDQYFSAELVGHAKHALIKLIAKRIRAWDVRTCGRVHHFIANSRYIRERIRRHYNRDAAVIYPPVDTARFTSTASHQGHYLIVSALVPYKRVDLAVQVFNELRLPLRIIGNGPELQKLKRMAGSTIEFCGWMENEALAEEYASARALVFPGEEDFGIVPVEAMASGKPVIAFGKGGALETVVDGVTGVHFPEQSIQSLKQAVEREVEMDFDAAAIRRHAETFDRSIYKERMREFIEDKWREWDNGAVRQST